MDSFSWAVMAGRKLQREQVKAELPCVFKIFPHQNSCRKIYVKTDTTFAIKIYSHYRFLCATKSSLPNKLRWTANIYSGVIVVRYLDICSTEDGRISCIKCIWQFISSINLWGNRPIWFTHFELLFCL